MSRPVSLPLSEYNLSATLYFENGNIAIDYPDVFVEKQLPHGTQIQETMGQGNTI